MQAAVWLPAVEVTLQWLALLVDLHGAHVRHHGLGLGLEDADELLQELGCAAVITLRDPYVAATRQRQPPLPLGEGATAVVLIGDVVADLGMGGIALEDAAALVGRAVVQQDELEVLEALPEDALDALL